MKQQRGDGESPLQPKTIRARLSDETGAHRKRSNVLVIRALLQGSMGGGEGAAGCHLWRDGDVLCSSEQEGTSTMLPARG